MKQALKLFLLTALIVSCGNDDNLPQQDIASCEIQDLGITETYKNPFPDNANELFYYTDWQWSVKEDENILILMFEHHDITSLHGDLQRDYFYFPINNQSNCVTHTRLGMLFSDYHFIEDEDGNIVYQQTSFLDADINNSTFELQDFNISDKIVGKIIYNNFERIFWVDFNDENYRELSDIEVASGF